MTCKFCVFIFALLVIPKNTFAQASSSLANRVFNHLKDVVYKVKVARDLNADKTSYGSGFPIAKNGLLITNYHVIRGVFKEDFEYKAFVTINDKPYSAKILGIDVVHDIALLKIDFQFPKIIEFYKGKINNGDKIFSMGFPQDLPLTIVEGTYNGVVKRGVYEEIHMSSGINSGMSGGPTLNKYAQLIGVNVSTMLFSQNISFAVPAKFAKDLLNENRLKDQSINTVASNQIISEQITTAQQSITNDILNNKRDSHHFHKWNVVTFPKYVRCWQSPYKEKSDKLIVEHRICNMENASKINDRITTGYYKSGFRIYRNKGLNGMQFYNAIYSDMADNIPSDLSGFFNGFKKEKGFSQSECRHIYLKSEKDIPYKVNYCLVAYTKYEHLYDAYFDGVSLLKNEDELVFSLSLYGFSKENIQNLIADFINSIERVE